METKKFKINKIYRNTHKQNGEPYTGKYGPYTMITLVLDGMEKKVYGRENKSTRDWKDGDTVKLELTQNDNGFWNFKTPKNVVGPEEFNELKDYVNKLYQVVNAQGQQIQQLMGNKPLLSPNQEGPAKHPDVPDEEVDLNFGDKPPF